MSKYDDDRGNPEDARRPDQRPRSREGAPIGAAIKRCLSRRQGVFHRRGDGAAQRDRRQDRELGGEPRSRQPLSRGVHRRPRLGEHRGKARRLLPRRFLLHRDKAEDPKRSKPIGKHRVVG